MNEVFPGLVARIGGRLRRIAPGPDLSRLKTIAAEGARILFP
jgi:hypothetical protein